jgi:hypothetical protein
MSLVFCTTCKNRTPHLRQTLPRNLSENPDSRFVVLDYNSEDDLLDFLSLFQLEIAQRRLTVYSYRGWEKFRMAHAKNLAHRLGILEGGEILVNLDADNFAGRRFEPFAQEQFKKGEVFLWSRMIHGDTDRGISGRIAVSRASFLKSGGYDEKFTEWAPDDKDFNLRLRIAGHQPVEIGRQFLAAVRHNDATRFKEYPHRAKEAIAEEFELTQSGVKKVVVNDGKIGCGTVFRNFDRDDIVEVRPIPTRIFGVGLSKTGTCSLHRALKILGFNSWHWSSAHAAKAIWQEMNEGNRSATLEKHEALCDLPIPLLYQKLDVAYPGSKFVLTMRKEGKWIDSIRRHFMPEHNPWRAGWNSDPFSHRVHKLAYGRCDFDESTFLDRYRSHNDQVLEYFKHRPESLLLLNVDKGDGWEKLCKFLDKPVPDDSFPHENAGGSKT